MHSRYPKQQMKMIWRLPLSSSRRLDCFVSGRVIWQPSLQEFHQLVSLQFVFFLWCRGAFHCHRFLLRRSRFKFGQYSAELGHFHRPPGVVERWSFEIFFFGIHFVNGFCHCRFFLWFQRSNFCFHLRGVDRHFLLEPTTSPLTRSWSLRPIPAESSFRRLLPLVFRFSCVYSCC